MKRNNSTFVVRTDRAAAILWTVYMLVFLAGIILGIILQANFAMFFSIVGVISNFFMVQNYYRKKEIVYLDRINEGILRIKDKKGKTYPLAINQMKYKISDPDVIILVDERYAVLLDKSKKMMRKLEELGALTEELE